MTQFLGPAVNLLRGFFYKREEGAIMISIRTLMVGFASFVFVGSAAVAGTMATASCNSNSLLKFICCKPVSHLSTASFWYSNINSCEDLDDPSANPSTLCNASTDESRYTSTTDFRAPLPACSGGYVFSSQ